MSELSLRLSENLALPLDAVTQTFAILAKRGVGKTYTAAVLVEELRKAGLQVIVLDPLDVWWGLRLAADGQGKGLSIAIIGGTHADLPLDADTGTVLADVVVEESLSAVFSLRHLSKAKQRQFVTDFCERLYERKGEEAYRSPLHIVIDEADAYVPQRVYSGQERMVGSIDDLVRRGRAGGIGVTLITQRSAAINKDVLTQIEVLIALRTISPQDRKAVESWIEAHDVHGQKQEFMNSLASLQIGEAWFWSPGWLDEFRRIQIRRRETFDSSATPKIGEQILTPKTLSEIDLARIEQRLAQVLERAKKEDPRQLQQLTQLEVEPVVEQAVKTVVETVVERVEVPVLREEQIAKLEVAVNNLIKVGEQIGKLGKEIKNLLQAATVGFADAGETSVPIGKASAEVEKVAQSLEGQIGGQITSTQRQQRHSDLQLKAGEHKMVAVLAACYPIKLSRTQLGTLSGFSPTGGTFSNYLSTLKRNGLIEESNKRLEMAPTGWRWLGAELIEITPSQWLSMWCEVLKAGERKMLEALVNTYPGTLTRLEIGQQTGYESTGGTFSNYLSTLRRNELVIEVRGSVFRANSKLIRQ